MLKDSEFSEQAEELGDIIDRLAAIAVTMRKAFVHQQSRPLEEIDNQYLDLSEEIAFDAAIADELMFGLSLDDKEPIFRYQKILAHLQMIDKSLKLLAELLRNQVKEGVLLFDREMAEIIILLDRQVNILRTLAEVVRSGDGERLQAVWNEFRELAGSCLKFATAYESRLAEGLCIPQAAPVFLKLVDRLQTLVHNEVETVGLLNRWLWDRVAVGPEEKPAGHFSF